MMSIDQYKAMGDDVADHLGLERWWHNPTGMVRACSGGGDYVRARDLAPLAAEREALLNEVERLRAVINKAQG